MATLWLMASTAGAATVYRWVDDAGKVHYSDVVPEPYRSRARPLEAPAAGPTAEQQREALERAGRDKARASPPDPRRDAQATSAAPRSTASGPVAKRPAQIPDERTDCATWQRLYMQSIECFDPYRTVRGGIKPEAFEVCNVVPEPPPSRCRMRIP